MTPFTLLKKNRKYFAAIVKGHKAKIIIDSNSEDLPLGEHTLDLEDKSVRTKYGTDLIFELKGSAKEQQDAGICTLTAPYNTLLVEQCRELGGKWDGQASTWVFSGLISDQIEELEALYSEDMTPVQITALEQCEGYQDPVTCAGVVIARASGRDSGAELGHDIAKVSGSINSGGSVKNWKTIVKEGSVFRFMMPKGLIELVDTDDWCIEVIKNERGV